MIYLILILFYIPVKIFFPTKVVGKENLKKGKSIIVCNHTSWLDPILLVVAMPSIRLNFMAKKELFKGRFRSWFIKSLGGYPIDRGQTDITGIKNTLYLLKKERSVVIFPEGTRNKSENEGEMLAIKNGVSMLAIKGKSPIIPMFFKRKPKFLRFNKLYVGESFTLDEFNDKKLTQQVLDEASGKIKVNLDNLKEKSITKGK